MKKKSKQLNNEVKKKYTYEKGKEKIKLTPKKEGKDKHVALLLTLISYDNGNYATIIRICFFLTASRVFQDNH